MCRQRGKRDKTDKRAARQQSKRNPSLRFEGGAFAPVLQVDGSGLQRARFVMCYVWLFDEGGGNGLGPSKSQPGPWLLFPFFPSFARVLGASFLFYCIFYFALFFIFICPCRLNIVRLSLFALLCAAVFFIRVLFWLLLIAVRAHLPCVLYYVLASLLRNPYHMLRYGNTLQPKYDVAGQACRGIN